jgi:hypothetical protein
MGPDCASELKPYPGPARGRTGFLGGFRIHKELLPMFRKCVAAFAALVICVGALFAEEIRGTFVKFADNKITVKVEDKEKEFKVAKDAVYKGKKEVPVADWAEKRAKEGAKLILNVDKDEVTWIKGGGK